MKTILMLFALSVVASAEIITTNGIDYNHNKLSGVDVLIPAKTNDYSAKIDFANLERHYPISRSVLDRLRPQDLMSWDMESLDQLYARLSSGPIPDGAFSGAVLPTNGGGIKKFQQSIQKLAKLGNVDQWAGWLWSGKHFYRDQMLLKNVMEGKFAAMKMQIGQLLHVSPTFVEAFPANVFCGQSLLDSRRESIVIDYSQSESLPGVGGKIVGKNGLDIRDEIRMVRPGFYLGRAYANKVFLLYFTVYNDSVAKSNSDRKDACWVGNQARLN